MTLRLLTGFAQIFAMRSKILLAGVFWEEIHALVTVTSVGLGGGFFVTARRWVIAPVGRVE
jgi:hypothetical protein